RGLSPYGGCIGSPWSLRAAVFTSRHVPTMSCMGTVLRDALRDLEPELFDQRGPFAFFTLDVLGVFFGRARRRSAAVGDDALLDVFRRQHGTQFLVQFVDDRPWRAG